MACGSFENLATNSGPCGLGDVQQPYDYTVYTPFVEFVVLGNVYTVGNKNGTGSAVIQSCNLNVIGNGKDGAFSGSIVIVTCDFNDVVELARVIPKSMCKYDEDYLGEGVQGFINFGWIFKNCGSAETTKYGIEGTSGIRLDNATLNQNVIAEDGSGEDITGPYIYALFNKVDVQFEEGYYKIDLQFTHLGDALDLFRNEIIEGTEDHKKKLWPSIKDIMTRRCDGSLAKMDVRKLRLADDGKNLIEWDFKVSDGGKLGPLGVWNTNQLPNPDAARSTLMSFTTDRDKAAFFTYPNQTKKPTFVFLEDADPNKCKGEKRKCPVNTYVINAGDCTNVLKYTTNFSTATLEFDSSESSDFVLKGMNGVGGGGPNAFSSFPERINTCEINLDQSTGNAENTVSNSSNGRQVSLPTNSEDLTHRSPSQVLNQLSPAVAAHLKASALSEEIGPIQATMEIIGDPFYTGIFNCLQRNIVQIIYINPFCIKKKNSGCQFLAEPAINPLASGFYRIAGVKHSISNGNYITTMELQKLVGDAAEDFEIGD